MIQDYIKIAFKNLRRRGLRSYLTLLGILIGITAVVALITLGTGLRVAVLSQFGISSTEIITIQAGGVTSFGPPGSGVTNPLTVEDIEAVQRVNGIERAIRRNIPTGKLEFKDEVVFGITMSIPDGDDRKFVYEELDLDLEQGRLLKDGDTNRVVLGNNFLEEKVGLSKKIEVGDKVKIQDKDFEVVGITKKKGSFIFDNIVHMNEKILQDLMEYEDNVDVIAVKVKDRDEIEQVKIRIEEALRESRGVDEGEEDFEVSTPQAALETVDQVLAGIQLFVVMIAFVAIFVGAIGIVNTMTTSVLERRKEIGIMKAIGAKNSDIFYQFFIESGLLGLVGGFVGVVLGLIIGSLGIIGINNFIGSTTKLQISVSLIVFSLVGSFVLGSVSGIAPALRAARQNPVDSLRK
jgi:putative ABC transport system permease protein